MYGAGSGNAFGGAVFTSGGSVFSSNVTFHANTAQAPSIYWDGAAGAARGGALYISNGVVHLRRGVLSSNTASGGFVRRSVGGLAQGGAVYNQGQLLLHEALLAGNRADGGYGYWGRRGRGRRSLYCQFNDHRRLRFL